MTSMTQSLQSESHTGTGRIGRVLRDAGYAITSGVISIPMFIVVVTGFSAGVGLAVVGIGFFVLLGTAYAARFFADGERQRLGWLSGRPAPRPQYRQANPNESWPRRIFTVLSDPSAWADVIWGGIVGFATGVTAFTLVIGWWAGTLGGLTHWFWSQWLPDSDSYNSLASFLGLGHSRVMDSVVNFVLGIAALLLLPAVTRLAARIHAGPARAMLSGRAEWQAKLRQAEGGREAARTAEASSLRRLERDIHDGPQQRLVRLQMDLARASRDMSSNPERAQAIIDEARRQAGDTVAELRALSRGIAPPVLVDRGLAAALNESFGRCDLPVRAHVEVPDDLPPLVETTVYFVVAEAMTNVVKHADATHLDVYVAYDSEQDVVRIEVTDNGIGGASVGKGHGLAGLQQRVTAARGEFAVISPSGGPTAVTAVVPCG